MSSVLVAEATRLHSARRNVLFALDLESYDLKSIRSLPGGFQLNLKADAFPPGRAPHNGPLKVAVPSDMVRWVKPIFDEAVPQSDPADPYKDRVARAKEAFRALLKSYDINGSVVLLDLDGHEEASLRRRHGVPKREGISPLFRRKPVLLESILEENILVNWDPLMTKFAFKRLEQSLRVRFCNEDESDLFTVTMKV
ncbi:hypothetical protein LQW54_007252 [Pestalotiopsis sp. IQ-011]